MKLHLPKGLLTAVLAVVGAWAGLANAETTTPAYSGTVYTFKGYNQGTDLAFSRLEYTNGEGSSATITGQSGNWSAISNAIATPTAGADRNTLKFVEGHDVSGGLKYTFNPIAVAGFIVDGAGYSIIPGSTGGERNIEIGNTNSTAAYSTINYSFTLNNSARTDTKITLHGTQTWDIANAAVFTLNTGTGNIQLSSGSSTTQFGGKVDFSGKSVTGSGAYTVGSGTLANATFASGTTLGVGTSAAFDAVRVQSGATLDFSALTLSADTAALSSANITLAESGIKLIFGEVSEGDTFKLYDGNVTFSLENLVINGEQISAVRSNITQENGCITFTSLGGLFTDMVWAGGESGTWNASDKNWNSATGGNGIAFANGDSVTFDSTAAVVATEGVVVGGMTVSGAETELALTSSNGGYVQGNVTVTDGATLILGTGGQTGLIHGSIDVVNGTLQINAKDATGWGGGATSTQSIKIAAGSELLLNNIDNETSTGSLVLNGTLKSSGSKTSRWDLYGNASITVEDGNNGVIENATLRLRKNDTVITVGNNATLTTAAIDNTVKDNEGNGFFKKEGAGSLIVGGAIDVKGITINGGSVTLNAGGSAGNINLSGGNTSLTFNATSDATAEAPTKYTVGTLGTTSSNNFGRNITIAENVEVAAANISNAWGMNALTVNGKLALTGELKFSTGGNNGNGNTIAGTGVITTNTLVFGNVGTYKLNVAELTVATSSDISKDTQILGGEVSLAALNLSANLRVNGGEVSMTGTTGNGTITGNAGIINMVGGTHTLNTLDLSNGGGSTAQVNLSNSAALSVGILKGTSSSSINVGEGSSVTASGVKVIGTANATTIAASQNSQYGAGNADFTITNATVEVAPAAESSTTLGNKIVDSNVTNTGDGALIVSDMTVTDASKVQSVLTGDMTVTKLTLASGLSETVAAVTTSGVLTLGSITLDLTDYAAGNYTLVSATGNGSIIWEDTAENALSYTGTLGKGLEASVDFAADNKTLQLTISEMVTPENPSITTTLPTSVTDVLGYEGGMLTLQVAGLLTENTMAVVDILGDPSTDALMAEVLRLVGDTKTVAITLVGTEGGELVADAFDKVVFVNEKGDGYYGESVMVGGHVMYNVDRIPEPASATLSLAALMMLCARRRRRA